MEFSRHAFPTVVVADMEAMGSPSLSHNMSYVVAQAMFYPVAGAHRIQLLSKMEAAYLGCGAQETILKHRITEHENDVHGFEQMCALLASEKVVTEEVRATLEAKVDSLTYANKGLMIQNESQECDVCDRNKLIMDARAEAEPA